LLAGFSGRKLLRYAKVSKLRVAVRILTEISDQQQSWGYEDCPWKGPGPPLLVAYELS